MSDIVDGPDEAAFDLPNTLQIGRLQIQIRQLEAASEKATDQRKQRIYDDQIKQLKENQNLLYRQTSGNADAAEADLPAVKRTIQHQHKILSAELSKLRPSRTAKAASPPTSVAPLMARIAELGEILRDLP